MHRPKIRELPRCSRRSLARSCSFLPKLAAAAAGAAAAKVASAWTNSCRNASAPLSSTASKEVLQVCAPPPAPTPFRLSTAAHVVVQTPRVLPLLESTSLEHPFNDCAFSVSSLEVPAVVHMLASPNSNILKRALQQVRLASPQPYITNRLSAVQCFFVTSWWHRKSGRRISRTASDPSHEKRRPRCSGAAKSNVRRACMLSEACCRIWQVIW